MAHTAQDLAESVLLELGRADAANPAEDADDIAFVKVRYTALYQALEDDDLTFWDEASIPERVFVPLTKLVAFEVRQPFGRTDYDLRDYNGRMPVQSLAALAADTDNTFPTKAVYF